MPRSRCTSRPGLQATTTSVLTSHDVQHKSATTHLQASARQQEGRTQLVLSLRSAATTGASTSAGNPLILHPSCLHWLLHQLLTPQQHPNTLTPPQWLPTPTALLSPLPTCTPQQHNQPLTALIPLQPRYSQQFNHQCQVQPSSTRSTQPRARTLSSTSRLLRTLSQKWDQTQFPSRTAMDHCLQATITLRRTLFCLRNHRTMSLRAIIGALPLLNRPTHHQFLNIR